MSLDKAIESGKEWRKPYYKAGKQDATCRPNGGCPWCARSKTRFDTRRRKNAELDLRFWTHELAKTG